MGAGMSSFRVGQKVVCVDDARRLACGDVVVQGGTGLVNGKVYTVQQIIPAGPMTYLGPMPRLSVKLILVEAQAPDGWTGFNAGRFRPVVDRKTDISVFTALLTPSKSKVPA